MGGGGDDCVLFAPQFVAFVSSFPSLYPNPALLSIRITKYFHKVSPFTGLTLVCVCVSYMCILRESSVSTSSSTWSHDLGLSHGETVFFPVKEPPEE